VQIAGENNVESSSGESALADPKKKGSQKQRVHRPREQNTDRNGGRAGGGRGAPTFRERSPRLPNIMRARGKIKTGGNSRVYCVAPIIGKPNKDVSHGKVLGTRKGGSGKNHFSKPPDSRICTFPESVLVLRVWRGLELGGKLKRKKRGGQCLLFEQRGLGKERGLS